MPSRHKVIVAPAAVSDAIEIGNYLREGSPGASRELLETMEEAFASLAQAPLRGASIPENSGWGSQYRHLLRGSYRIIYKVKGKEVHVLKVIHGARLLRIEPGKEAPHNLKMKHLERRHRQGYQNHPASKNEFDHDS